MGDGHNDLEMIKNANIGIAMENTTCLELKIVADYIAPLIDNDEMFDFFKKLKLDINYFDWFNFSFIIWINSSGT